MYVVSASYRFIVLSSGCSNADYELVRIYHPDSPVSRVLPASTAQTRFQAITHAYDVLRGKTSHPSAINSSEVNVGEVDRAKASFRNLETAMWRAKQQRRAEMRGMGGVGMSDRTKDAIMVGAVVLVSFVVQTCAEGWKRLMWDGMWVDGRCVCCADVFYEEGGVAGAARTGEVSIRVDERWFEFEWWQAISELR